MTFRERVLSSLEGARTSEGFRVTRLHFGPPADRALLDRIERDVLRQPLPAALRAFYEETNGASLVQIGSYDDAPNPPPTIVPEQEGPLAWDELSSEFHGAWPAVSDAAKRTRGSYVATINIPDAETVFFHDWNRAFGMSAGFFAFDLFHHYNAAFLQRSEGDLRVGLATDHMASLYDYDTISVETYLEHIANDPSTRSFPVGGSPRYLNVHSKIAV